MTARQTLRSVNSAIINLPARASLGLIALAFVTACSLLGYIVDDLYSPFDHCFQRKTHASFVSTTLIRLMKSFLVT